MKTTKHPETIIALEVSEALAKISQVVAHKGTDLGLYQACYTLLSGRLRGSKGALIPALVEGIGNEQAARQAYHAVKDGVWEIESLTEACKRVLLERYPLKRVQVDGKNLVVADMTAIQRPKLAKCQTKHYDGHVGRAVPAIPVGIYGGVYQTESQQRVVIPDELVFADEGDPSHSGQRDKLLEQVCEQAAANNELLITDRECTVVLLGRAGAEQFLTRVRLNSTFSRGEIPPKTRRGRTPTRRPELVRPIASSYTYKDAAQNIRVVTLLATPPDETYEIDTVGSAIKTVVHVLKKNYARDSELQQLQKEIEALSPADGQPIDPATHLRQQKMRQRLARMRTQPLTVFVVDSPLYKQPAIYVTTLETLAIEELVTIYHHRWPIELIPQTGKNLLGGDREYVHQPRMTHRLPALLFTMATFANVVATQFPPLATGYWDRNPKRTAGRLSRALMKLPIPCPSQLSKKNASCSHLPLVSRSRWQKHLSASSLTPPPP